MPHNWITFDPADKETAATLRFILSFCQDVKDWTYGKVERGERKTNLKPQEELLAEWMKAYLLSFPLAEGVPRFSLRNAINTVLEKHGADKHPADRLDWHAFSVEPRDGWSMETREKSTLSWDAYLRGVKRGKKGQTVTPAKSVTALFAKGRVAFRWGRLDLKGGFENKLLRQSLTVGIAKEDFLRSVERMEVARKGEEDVWKIRFVLKGEKA